MFHQLVHDDDADPVVGFIRGDLAWRFVANRVECALAGRRAGGLLAVRSTSTRSASTMPSFA